MNELFGFLLDNITNDLTQFITNGVAVMQAAMRAPLAIFAFIYLGLTAYMIYFGHIQMTMGELFKRAFRILIAVLLVTNSAFFAQWVIGAFWGTAGSVGIPDSVGQLILESTVSSGTGSGTTQMSGVAATYSDRVDLVAAGIKASGGFFAGLTALIVSFFLWVVMLVGFFIIVISKMGMAILLVIGPFILAGNLFGFLKGMIDGWFKQLLNFALTAILGYAIMSIMLTVTSNFAETIILRDVLSKNGASAAFSLIVLSLISAIVLWQVPQIATGIAGGAPLSDLGTVGRMGRAAGRYADGKGQQAQEIGHAAYAKAAPAVSSAASNARAGAKSFAQDKIAPHLPPAALKMAQTAVNTGRQAEKVARATGRASLGAAKAAYKTVAPRTSTHRLNERYLRQELKGKK